MSIKDAVVRFADFDFGFSSSEGFNEGIIIINE